ncbi:MAG: hypothetical protein ACJAZ1_000231 [Yoonia sp.]|jgi:hypothetical protein
MMFRQIDIRYKRRGGHIGQFDMRMGMISDVMTISNPVIRDL